MAVYNYFYGNTLLKMSKPKIDSDGFQIVTSKRFSKNKPTKIPSRSYKLEQQDILIDADKTLRKIQAAFNDLKCSEYLKRVLKTVSSILQSKKVVEIVCFGLGHIGECQISRYQVAFLLCLKDICSPKKVSVHDPIFYKTECEVLRQLGLYVIEENKEGNYIISEQGVTVVYLPHCPKQLTNNFLWSNWSKNLVNCVLICNSFSTLIENQPGRILCGTVPYIVEIFPFTTETVLENNFKFTDIFNDTSVHYFTKENLENCPSEFWIKRDKPQYENSEEFITSLMIEKLNI